MILETCSPPTQDDFQKGVKKKQIVMELDANTWQLMISKFNIEEPVIPHREPANQVGFSQGNGGAQWQ